MNRFAYSLPGASSPLDGEGAASDVAVVDDGPSSSDIATTDPPPETAEPCGSQEDDADLKDGVPAGEAPIDAASPEGESKEAEPAPTESAAESSKETGDNGGNGVR